MAANDVIKNLEKVIEKDLPDTLMVGVNQLLLAIQAEAQEECPVDTGTLRRSITVSPAEKEGEDIAGSVYTNIEYGPYVELGTYKAKAQPYLEPAAQKVAGELELEWKAEL